MGLGYTSKKGTPTIPVWQRNGSGPKALQGGFILIIAGLIADGVLQAGTPMVADESARTATPLVTGKAAAAAGASATDYSVVKGSHFKVGDYLASTVGGAAYAITEIDTSGASVDVLTVGTTIGAVAEGGFLFKSTATGANAAALGNINGLLYEETKVASGTTCSVVYDGAVYANRVPYSADVEAALPRILYSKSL